MGPRGCRLGLFLSPPLAGAWHPLPLKDTESFTQGLQHPAVSQALQQGMGLRQEVSSPVQQNLLQ